jgi:predicted TIM-barrel fold metal-dependent hydrolase
MRIIDAHVHVGDNYKPMTPFQDTGRVDRLLRLMDECEVEKAVMVPVVAEFSPDNNSECARWSRQHPDRLAAMTDVAMHELSAIEEVARAREEYGAVAISYYPNSADISWMLEPRYEPIWDALKTYVPVFNLHVSPPNYPTLLELARRHIDLLFVCNHLGLPGQHFEPTDSTYGGLIGARALPNVYIKASAFYAAAATPWDFRCPRALGFFTALLRDLGPRRLLWGTDWPPTSNHLTYRQSLEIVRSCAEGVDEDALELVLGENAARVFGI